MSTFLNNKNTKPFLDGSNIKDLLKELYHIKFDIKSKQPMSLYTGKRLPGQDHFVNLKTAIAMKNAGFDDVCRSYYGGFNDKPFTLARCDRSKCFDSCWNSMLERDYCDDEETYIAAPTQALAMAWLRDDHDLHIVIDHSPKYWNYSIINLKTDECVAYKCMPFNSYEDAAEDAIYNCLTNYINN